MGISIEFTIFTSLLLHTEISDGTVVPVWEEVQNKDVVVLKDIMAARRELNDVILQYNRIPITAETPPDYSDLKELIEVVLCTPPDTPIVVNCQLGRGRSTLVSVRLSGSLFDQIENNYLDHTHPHPTMASNPSSSVNPSDNPSNQTSTSVNVYDTTRTHQASQSSFIPSN